MSNLKNKLQHLVEGQIPEYLRVSYPRFASFIKEYYTFLDTNRQANAVLLNSNTWTDVDLTLDLFVDEMRKQHAYDISSEALTEQRRLIKFINQYYEAKGTENAAELYFRMMYNDTATIKYPGDYVLRASDGVWQSKKTLKIDTDFTQIDPASLDLAPADLRENASDVFSLKEKTIYLKYHRREPTGLKLYSHELGCVEVGRIITNNDIFELEVDVPKTINVKDFNEALATLSYYDTVWVTAFVNGTEYVYGFLTQQLIGYTILSGGENFRRRDTFTVEVEESPLYPIPGQENNNGIIRVTSVTKKDVEEYFASDYVSIGSEYAASDTEGVINNFRFISTGHRFDVTGDYFAELYNEDDDYTTYKDFTRVLENPRKSRFSTLVTGDYFEEREGVTSYMEFNDDRGYTDFNETIYNLSSATVRFEVGYIYEHPGAWKNNAGFLSDINKLQDNYYYQAYSYVVQTKNVPYETWNTLYKNSAHPAGFIVFGELLVENDITFTPIDITSTQYIINNFDDGVQPIDTVAKHVAKPVADTFSVNENSVYNFNKVLTDTAVVDDVSGLELNIQPVFSDIVVSSDILAKDINIANITDGVVTSETFFTEITIERSLEDTIITSDTVSTKNISKSVEDNISNSDILTYSLTKPNITDSVNTVDSVEKNISIQIDGNTYNLENFFEEEYVSDNVVTVSDEFLLTRTYFYTDTVTVDDTPSVNLQLNKTEDVETTDTVDTIFIEKNIADSVIVSDIKNIVFSQEDDVTSDLTEQVSITDSIEIFRAYSTDETVNINDSNVLLVGKNVSDSVSSSETINTFDVDKNIIDTVLTGEIVIRDFEKFFNNTTSLSDLICIALDDYIATGYVDTGYAGTVNCT